MPENRLAPEHEPCRSSILKIYRYENRELYGTLENNCLPGPVYFQNTMQLIFFLEEQCDAQKAPQAGTEKRSFFSTQINYLLTRQKIQQFQEQIAQAREEDTQCLLAQQIEVGELPLATFILQLYYRNNSSWQGKIGWKQMNYTVQFRSLLELLRLLDEVLLLLQKCGGIMEFGKLLKEPVETPAKHQQENTIRIG